MINHEFDIIRVLIASQDDEMIKKLILCLTENAYETVTVNNKTDARKNLLSFQPHILLVKEPDSWDKFNNWMLKSSILKKKLNDYNLQEIKDLERQLRATESNYQASAEKAGNKAWYHKNKFPIPSKN